MAKLQAIWRTRSCIPGSLAPRHFISCSWSTVDVLKQVGVTDGLSSLDLLHLAVEAGPAHALGLVDRAADTIRSKPLAALERLADGAIIRALPLKAVDKP